MTTLTNTAPIQAQQPPVAIQPLGGKDRLFTTPDAARYINLGSGNTMEVWRSTGNPNQPDYIRVGRRIYYKQSALDAWIDANTVTHNA